MDEPTWEETIDLMRARGERRAKRLDKLRRSFWDSLTPEQQRAALAYRGPENIGPVKSN